MPARKPDQPLDPKAVVKDPLSGPKVSEAIVLRNYAFVRQAPDSLHFSGHMLRYRGLDLEKAPRDLLWGVQGTTSINAVDVKAGQAASAKGEMLLQLEMVYRVPGFREVNLGVNEKNAKKVGYLHMLRLTADYRDQLRDSFMDWVRAEVSGAQIDYFASLDLEDLLAERPHFVHRLMKETPGLSVVVHKVIMNDGRPTQIATVRNLPERVAALGVRFRPEIAVSI